MKTEFPWDKPASRAFEKVVLSLIGILSLASAPFCFLAVMAVLYGGVASDNPKSKIPIYYSISISALISLVGIFLAVVGWKLIKSKKPETEELFRPFYPWIKRVGGLFSISFGLEGIMWLRQHKMQLGIGNIVLGITLMVIILWGKKIKQYFEKQ